MTTPASNSKNGPEFTEPVTPVTVDKEVPKRTPFGVRRAQTDTPGGTPDSPPRDTPPKRRKSAGTGTGATAKNATTAIPYTEGVISGGLQQFYGQIGMVVGMFDEHCGTAIIQNAIPMAASMEAWAKESPAAREFLNKLVTTSVIGQVIAAHTPMVMAIAMHHVPAIRKKFNPPVPAPGDSGTGASGNAKVA